MKITRIRIYRPKRLNPSFNQSDMLVTVETDGGLTGIGEGGTRDTLEQCAGMLIGEDPERIQHLWQMVYRGYFYPAGREKLHALGALDLALWDIKGKRYGAPLSLMATDSEDPAPEVPRPVTNAPTPPASRRKAKSTRRIFFMTAPSVGVRLHGLRRRKGSRGSPGFGLTAKEGG